METERLYQNLNALNRGLEIETTKHEVDYLIEHKLVTTFPLEQYEAKLKETEGYDEISRKFAELKIQKIEQCGEIEDIRITQSSLWYKIKQRVSGQSSRNPEERRLTNLETQLEKTSVDLEKTTCNLIRLTKIKKELSPYMKIGTLYATLTKEGEKKLSEYEELAKPDAQSIEVTSINSDEDENRRKRRREEEERRRRRRDDDDDDDGILGMGSVVDAAIFGGLF